MADNPTLPATGSVVAADDIGGVLFPRMKLVFGADGVNGGDVTNTAGQGLPVQAIGGAVVDLGAKADAKSAATDTTAASLIAIQKQHTYSLQAAARMIIAAASAYTRPANVTAYSANDAVSNNATAASVTAVSFTVSDTNDEPISVERIRIDTNDTGAAGASFRVYLFNSDPTASTGVGGGDNAAWSQKKAGFIGSFVGTFKTFSDGGLAICTPEDGSRAMTAPVSGAKTLFALLQTLTAFTPSANSTTFTLTLEALQGRA